jgi:hypothetical protein
MSFQPTIVGSGLLGWQFLRATMDTQVKAFNSSTTLNRDIDYFKENIGKVETPEDLVNDRRLLSVALSAFGLEDQIDSKFMIKKVLEEGTEDDNALANKLNDGRYTALANAFKFEKVLEPKTQEAGFGEDLLKRYEANVLANMEAGLADTGDTNTSYGDAIREQVKLNIERDTADFKAAIGSVTSAQDLIANPTLYRVTMVAFDLEGKSPALMQRVLEQGTDDATDLANVLGDQRMVDMAKTFEFNREPVSPLADPAFADEIISDYRNHEFEVAIGNVDNTLRTALNFERAMPGMATAEASDNTKWYQVLGTTSLRNVFEAALGLPSGFSQIDLDKQVETLKEKTERRFGIKEFSELAEPENMNRVIETYLMMNQVREFQASNTSSAALTLLQQIPTNSILG